MQKSDSSKTTTQQPGHNVDGISLSQQNNYPSELGSSTPESSSKRQRSISLPSHQLEETALFPSPSSSFHPPPSDEAEVLRNLLARDRARRDASRAGGKYRLKSANKKRSTSMGSRVDMASPESSTKLGKRPSYQEESMDTRRAAEESEGIIPRINPSNVSESTEVPSSDEEGYRNAKPGGRRISNHGAPPTQPAPRRQLSESSTLSTGTEDTATGYDTPRNEPEQAHQRQQQITPTAISNALEKEQTIRQESETPSRPASSYIPYLPELDASSAEVARRLSLSTSRRHSRLSASSSSSGSSAIPAAPSAADAVKVTDHDSPVLQQTASTFEIKIKDFAFPNSDPRHIGQPADPSLSASEGSSASGENPLMGFGLTRSSGANHRWNPRVGTLSENVFDDSSSDGGMSSSGRRFSNNSGSAHSPYAWDSIPPYLSTARLHSSQDSGNSPLLNVSSPSPLVHISHRDSLVSEQGSSDTENPPYASSSGPEVPPEGALYVAAYEFLPEASQEMRLYEGEVVRVLERLCEGWVVASRTRRNPQYDGVPGEQETGLVPDAFLRPIGDQKQEAAGKELNNHASYLKAMSRMDINASTSPPLSPR